MIVGYADFSDWDKPAGAGLLVSSTFTFLGVPWFAVPGSEDFSGLPEGLLTFGWTQMCANDIMLGSVAIPGAEIPEPGTLLLLGTGLVDLVVRRRRQS